MSKIASETDKGKQLIDCHLASEQVAKRCGEVFTKWHTNGHWRARGSLLPELRAAQMRAKLITFADTCSDIIHLKLQLIDRMVRSSKINYEAKFTLKV